MVGYLHKIVDSARALADCVDVTVLAQASMAAAVEHLEDLAVPVLSSPRVGILSCRGPRLTPVASRTSKRSASHRGWPLSVERVGSRRPLTQHRTCRDPGDQRPGST